MNIIDPHVHLFNLQQGQYLWLKPENPPFWHDKALIHRQFLESDLTLSKPLNLSAFVHIEAGFDNLKPWREIAWLEAHCQRPFKSVATLNLTLNSDEFLASLDKLSAYQSVIGGRQILDEQAQQLLSNNQVHENLSLLANRHYLFEAQLDLADQQAVALLATQLSQQPTLTIVINHAGCPSFNGNDWISGLNTLSQFRNCWIKCSGWEMRDRNYTDAVIEQTINQVLSTFSQDRIMLASNFPLSNFSTSYQALWHRYQTLNFSEELIGMLCHDNAKACYHL